ncbi:YceD family protein [Candidatus Poriferisodalis sp.]|uniref:YceD family protein n=1 Tax=Candidatus Poriferisodalis sp. TaxID=3101277 RepID=UPI003B59D09D
MSRRDPKRSLSVPLRLVGDGELEWSATVAASDLAERDSPDALRIADVEVPLDSAVGVELALERISGGLSVAGQLTATWKGPCARCWLPIDGEVRTTIREVFTAEPREGEQYRLDPEHADLVPMVREAVLLELPIEAIPCPHADPCPNLPSELAPSHDDSVHDDSVHDDAALDDSAELADPRWAALEALRGHPDESS